MQIDSREEQTETIHYGLQAPLSGLVGPNLFNQWNDPAGVDRRTHLLPSAMAKSAQGGDNGTAAILFIWNGIGGIILQECGDVQMVNRNSACGEDLLRLVDG
jgi:hypothetical protein